jgi:hypothetical protein
MITTQDILNVLTKGREVTLDEITPRSDFNESTLQTLDTAHELSQVIGINDEKFIKKLDSSYQDSVRRTVAKIGMYQKIFADTMGTDIVDTEIINIEHFGKQYTLINTSYSNGMFHSTPIDLNKGVMPDIGGEATVGLEEKGHLPRGFDFIHSFRMLAPSYTRQKHIKSSEIQIDGKEHIVSYSGEQHINYSSSIEGFKVRFGCDLTKSHRTKGTRGVPVKNVHVSAMWSYNPEQYSRKDLLFQKELRIGIREKSDNLWGIALDDEGYVASISRRQLPMFYTDDNGQAAVRQPDKVYFNKTRSDKEKAGISNDPNLEANARAIFEESFPDRLNQRIDFDATVKYILDCSWVDLVPSSYD